MVFRNDTKGGRDESFENIGKKRLYERLKKKTNRKLEERGRGKYGSGARPEVGGQGEVKTSSEKKRSVWPAPAKKERSAKAGEWGGGEWCGRRAMGSALEKKESQDRRAQGTRKK